MHPRHDKRYANSQYKAESRFKYEQTWNGGAAAVAHAIQCGILKSFWGRDGIEYVQEGSYCWGHEQSIDTNGGIRKARK